MISILSEDIGYKMKKNRITLIIILIMIIFTSLAYFNFLSANKTSCQAYRNTAPKENIFSKIITEEVNQRLVDGKKWRMYTIFFSTINYMISETPKDYLSSAIRIILSKDYDQSQKVYTIILMQNLPIKEYMCFMDAVNEQFEKGLIDKEVARFAILPDINLYSTSIYYWWLPDWRKV